MGGKILTPEECLKALQSQTLRRINDLPNSIGIYALADHLGDIHYIGKTDAKGFRDRITNKHVSGSEESSHMLSCNYNIGRMYRDRKSDHHVARDAEISKEIRRKFIRRHCRVAIVPIVLPKHELKALEEAVIDIAPECMTCWNAKKGIIKGRVNQLPEPRELVDELIAELGYGPEKRAALDRQALLFEKHGHKMLAGWCRP
jgi:hypothetical protein